MSEPTHAVVKDGVVSTITLMDVATAELFREYGFVEMMWPGSILVDITDLDPRPAQYWTYDGETFSPPPEQSPDPVTEPTP